jgi:hypothetical protein
LLKYTQTNPKGESETFKTNPTTAVFSWLIENNLLKDLTSQAIEANIKAEALDKSRKVMAIAASQNQEASAHKKV